MVTFPPGFTGFIPRRWTGEPLALYHGTIDMHVSSILSGVQVSRGRPHTDFGQGFYTTTVERQAIFWALRQAERYPGTHPAVIRFDMDRNALASLESLWFVRGAFDAEDFWSFVFHCRGGGSDHGRGSAQLLWYDVVVGPVVASWRQRLAFWDADQVSFHTERAAELLNRSNPRRVI